ncbi:MAG: hypothetical protein Q4D56_11100, partial [Bacteroides sp.]|nr:hypothetical protein [Bacteroides sp.]
GNVVLNGDTSGSSSYSSSSSYGSSGSSSSSRKESNVQSRNRLTGNYSALSRSYSNWESRLIKMANYPEKYSKQDFNEVPSIQRKMKEIREKITEMGGTQAQSKWETWKP